MSASMCMKDVVPGRKVYFRPSGFGYIRLADGSRKFYIVPDFVVYREKTGHNHVPVTRTSRGVNVPRKFRKVIEQELDALRRGPLESARGCFEVTFV